MPEAIKAPLRILWSRMKPAPDLSYAARTVIEAKNFAGKLEINDLPPIYHYWSHTYLRPKLQHFGCSNPDEFFANELQKAFAESGTRPARFISLGAGNCDTEIRVARILRSRGIHEFVIECLDINPVMLGRGNALARNAEVGDQVISMVGDFNTWLPAPQENYDAVMANQSLHHVVDLEHLFDSVSAALTPNGRFVVSDMIGRNGHKRWPEAMSIVREFWRELPQSHRYNLQLRRHEQQFLDWDCSGEGFEGIRAQDILPLLVERFEFEMFLPFANVIDPFIDRGFGPNFDSSSPQDLDLIDRIHARDEKEISAGRIKPTHLIAVLRNRGFQGEKRYWKHLTPESCVRPSS